MTSLWASERVVYHALECITEKQKIMFTEKYIGKNFARIGK